MREAKDRTVFPIIGSQDLEALARLGEPLEAGDGQILQQEGEPATKIFVVLSGKLSVYRRLDGAPRLIAVLNEGEFSGDLNLLTNKAAPYTVQSCGASHLLALDKQAVRTLIAEGSALSDTLLETMARRAHHMDTHLIQEEKLAALGKMAAGLAHELNNPASAARRASKLMLETVQEAPVRMLGHDQQYSDDERKYLMSFADELLNRASGGKVEDPLELSDREMELCDWLCDHKVPRIEDLAPTLAQAGVTQEQIKFLHGKVASCHFVKALFWLELVIHLTALARDIETSTDRIAELVGALKEYSYMDQARFQEVDIHKGIESTLKIMHHKLKRGVTVKREYSPDLPKVCAFPGELNQVWTNLIDNAVDAMDGKGTLTICTRQFERDVIVEIRDTGKGIPPELLNRIFEPFFTTKPQGMGTGLGLDISYRIVVFRHSGSIRVYSKPGDTLFKVQIPIQPPKEAELLSSANQPETSVSAD